MFPLYVINPDKTGRYHNITNAQYNYLDRNGLLKDNTITKETYDKLPYMREMAGYNNTMRVSFTPAQMKKVNYGHVFQIKPEQVDTRDGFVVRNMSKEHVKQLVQSKRTRRKIRIRLTDAELS